MKIKEVRCHGFGEKVADASMIYSLPIPKELADITENLTVKDRAGEKAVIRYRDLLQTTIEAVYCAWTGVIRSIINGIRFSDTVNIKRGLDYFTQADIESEQVIRNIFLNEFGEKIKVFGEEENKFIGNENARVSIFIDPIDGTKTLKLAHGDGWAIMVGIYEELSDETRHQYIAVIYFPEKEKILYYVAGYGTYIVNERTRETWKAYKIPERDNLESLLVCIWKCEDAPRRGNVLEIEDILFRKLKATVRTTQSAAEDVLQAIETNGQRILIIDGDYNEVDFIPHVGLTVLGYTMFVWNEKKKIFQQTSPEGKSLVYGKVIAVPPGKAGKAVIKTIEKCGF